MDPHDDQNQEFRRLDSKMIEDSKSEDLLIKDSNSQALRSQDQEMQNQNRIYHSQNIFFESRESFNQRTQQINSNLQKQQTNQRSSLNPFFNNHLFDNQIPSNPNQILQEQLQQINWKTQIQNRQNLQNMGRYTPKIQRIQQNFQENSNFEVQNNSLFSQTSSKKRNFKKLLADQSLIPENQYYPNENEILLQNKFKKLKISHNQDLRQTVELCQLSQNQSQIFNFQNNPQIHQSQNSNQTDDQNKNQSHNEYFLEQDQNILRSDQRILELEELRNNPNGKSQILHSPENFQQLILSRGVSSQNQSRPQSKSSKRLESRKSRGLYFVGNGNSDSEISIDSRILNNQDEEAVPIKGQQESQNKKKLSKLQSRALYHEKMKSNRYYRYLLESKPEIANFTVRQVQKELKTRANVSFHMKCRIIEMRFGEIHSMRPRGKSISKISSAVSISRSTVYKIIKDYLKNNGNILHHEKHLRTRIIESQIQVNGQEKSLISILKDPQTLRDWAHLSLDARCALLKSKYNIQISRFTLGKYYRELKISYLKTHSSFYSSRTEEEMVQLRVEFIKKIVKHMKRKREIIFMDETSTNMWIIRNKIWQPQDSVLPLIIQKSREQENNVTIIGAISLKMKIIFHHVTNSTNIETVENFFKKLDKKYDLFNKVIVMDNHGAHKSNNVTEFLESKGAIIEFLPPNSSYFNPIETIWSWVKSKWRNTLLQLQDLKESHKDWMQTELSSICKSCPSLVIHNIVNSCNGLMKKFLKEYAPESEELQFLEHLEKQKLHENQNFEEAQNQSANQNVNAGQILS